MAEMADFENGYAGDHLDGQRNALRVQMALVCDDTKSFLTRSAGLDPTDPFEETREKIAKLGIILDELAADTRLPREFHPVELDRYCKMFGMWLRSTQIRDAHNALALA